MFGAIAHRYDLDNRVHSFGRDQAWRRRAVRLCRVRATDQVLDAACGTGDLAEAFAAAEAGRVVGVDFCPQMIDLARRKSARRPTRGPAGLQGRRGVRPDYVLGDVMDLQFGDGGFDIVSIAFGIRNVSSPQRALGEFRRVLRPRGRLVILEFGQPTNSVLRRINGLYCDHVMPLTATFLAGDRSGAYRYLPKSVVTFADPQALAGMMEDAGFVSISVHPMTFGVCVGYMGHVPKLS